MEYRAYTLNNFRKIPQIESLSEAEKFAIEVVGHVLPFRTNNFVTEELIDWDNAHDDPIFRLTFPQREMLSPTHFERMARALRDGRSKRDIEETANRIRLMLNPHPAGQIDENTPFLDGQRLDGIQHKYKETVLVFPGQGQTCHAYCTFCFRWPQFVGMDDLKITLRQVRYLVAYLRRHPEVTDILITGGDPLIMRTRILKTYIEPLLEADLPNLQTIRIGTKALSYWPYRFLSDPDADDLLDLFRGIVRLGVHLAVMAHFTHPRELRPRETRIAIRRVLGTGAQIRTQAPLLSHINDHPRTWIRMWNAQVRLGCIPYYMFIPRNTGAQHYFAVPLVRAWKIYQAAYQKVSGLSRTVRGPSMSTRVGKVQVLGICEIRGEKLMALQFLQGRNPNWARRPFFARYDEEAIWLNDLEPPFDEERFFFEETETPTRRDRTFALPQLP